MLLTHPGTVDEYYILLGVMYENGQDQSVPWSKLKVFIWLNEKVIWM